jgi:hypothetical protein
MVSLIGHLQLQHSKVKSASEWGEYYLLRILATVARCKYCSDGQTRVL